MNLAELLRRLFSFSHINLVLLMSVCARLAAIDSGREEENALAMCVLGAITLIRIPVQRGQGMRVGQRITGVNWAKTGGNYLVADVLVFGIVAFSVALADVGGKVVA